MKPIIIQSNKSNKNENENKNKNKNITQINYIHYTLLQEFLLDSF